MESTAIYDKARLSDSGTIRLNKTDPTIPVTGAVVAVTKPFISVFSGIEHPEGNLGFPSETWI